MHPANPSLARCLADSPFASMSPQLLSPSATSSSDSDSDTDAAQRRKADLQAAALLLMELFMVGLAPADAQGQSVAVMDGAGLQRMLFDVFHESIEQFRDYCTHVSGAMAVLCSVGSWFCMLALWGEGSMDHTNERERQVLTIEGSSYY